MEQTEKHYHLLKYGSIFYRLTQAYFNERGVGAGIKDSGVAREDFFLVTKVWVTNYGRAYDSLQE